MRQLTIDGRQEDVVIGRNVQDHLFTAPQTMKGQLPMPEPHKCGNNHARGSGGNAYCSCGWEGGWRAALADVFKDARRHREQFGA